MRGLLNIHFAFPESFRNTFEKVNCGNDFEKPLKEKIQSSANLML